MTLTAKAELSAPTGVGVIWLDPFSSTKPHPTEKGEPPQEKELQKTGNQSCRTARQNLSDDFYGKK